MSVLIFGSLNLDLVTRTARLPRPGETLTGRSFATVPGGKGANQAVAVARLGIPAAMVGRVGGDDFGGMLRQSLQAAGVNCEGVITDASTSSGVAAIAVDDQGENHIIIVPGANGQVDASDVERLKILLPNATSLLLQLEIPLPAVVAAAQAAKQAGVRVILDPAPALDALPEELYGAIAILTPNQVEASQLVGFAVDDRESATRAAAVLRERGVAIAIIKMGRQGALCSTAEGDSWIEPFVVEAIDTVAAGDAFNGGLAAGLASGLSLQQACRWAAATAALSVTKAGAQAAMPTREELDAFLASRL
ncbi:MAG: ribokinase [Oculatellaceae cyanobacterium Prado106]|jgi:ribokinase|nr:ribokinase [Oculatellaceae cyanobacterium Prado106]